MAIILAFGTIALSACTAGNLRQPAISTPDTRSAVFSNGGMAVQMGQYVYFVNGHSGFSDPDADQNIFRQVQKGGLYRATQRGNLVRRRFNFWYGYSYLYVFDAQVDRPTAQMTAEEREQASRLEFNSVREARTEWELDEDGEYVRCDDGYRVAQPIPGQYNHTVTVEQVISKRIGQANTIQGGVFILGEWIFFSSPHNLRDHAGNVQYSRTDFFRSRLDGSLIEKIYTTVNHRDAGNNPIAPQYAFHKFNGSYFLIVLDGNDIISVEMDRGGSRTRSPNTIATNVSNAYFPIREIYYNGINEAGVENFIFFTRNSVQQDTLPRGNVLELMRPNGEERAVIYNGGGTATILGTDNGIFFYSATVQEAASQVTAVFYSNLHDLLMSEVGGERISPTYYETWRNGAPFSDVTGYIRANEFAGAIRLVGLRPNHNNADSVYVLGFSDSGVVLFSKAGAPVVLSHSSAEFVAINRHAGHVHGTDINQRWNVYDGWTLFLNDNGSFFSVNLFDGGDFRQLGTGFNGGPDPFRLDILPNFAVFFANAPDVSPQATNYAWFVRLNDRYADAFLVAYIIEDERPSAEVPVIEDDEYEDEVY